MIKNVLAVTAIVFALGACSSSSDSTGGGTDDGGSTDGGTDGGTDSGTGGDTGTLPPATDTKAGTYTGNFGSGEGVYVISNDNTLSGLALAPTGAANSLFGDIGAGNTFEGELRSYTHPANTPAGEGSFAAGESGDLASVIAPTEFNLNIVNGQTITSLSGADVNLVGSGTGALTPATPASVAGSWSGDHRYCNTTTDVCTILRTEITFSNTSVAGRTVLVDADGNETFVNPIAGSIGEFGDVSLLSFTWLTNTYNGVIFFAPGETGKLVFLGETEADANNKTIASLLTQ